MRVSLESNREFGLDIDVIEEKLKAACDDAGVDWTLNEGATQSNHSMLWLPTGLNPLVFVDIANAFAERLAE